MKQSLATLLLLSEVSASGVEFDYTTNGADWPDSYPDCALTNQSPIDLISAAGTYETYASTEDMFTKTYSNQENVAVAWVGDTSKVTLDADLVRGMRALVQRERVTLYAGLLTVFQVMLHRYSGQDDILVGSPFAGRHPFDEGLAEVVGNFANSVVLRSTCSSSEPVTFRKMLKRTWGKVCCSSSFFF